MEKISQIIHAHYPISKSAKEIIASSLFVGIATYLFLSVFEPFGTYTYKHTHKYLLLAPYSFISFFLFALSNLIVKSNSWTILKESIKIFITLLVCATINYWYVINFINLTGFDISEMGFMYLFTFAVGIPICIMYALARYILLTGIEKIYKDEEADNKNFLEADIKLIRPDSGSILSINKNDFLYAQSEGNYSTVYYLIDGSPTKNLLRISLSKLQKQINCPEIIRCHRSYIVNTFNVINIKGNAQGYKLSFANINETVPVSRKYISEFQNIEPKGCRS